MPAKITTINRFACRDCTMQATSEDVSTAVVAYKRIEVRVQRCHNILCGTVYERVTVRNQDGSIFFEKEVGVDGEQGCSQEFSLRGVIKEAEAALAYLSLALHPNANVPEVLTPRMSAIERHLGDIRSADGLGKVDDVAEGKRSWGYGPASVSSR